MLRKVGILHLSILAAALCAPPQDAGNRAPQPEVRGVVLEPGTNQPVVDAVVSFYFLGAERPRVMLGTALLDVTGTVTTDASGAFATPLLQLGYYRVAAKKQGYVSNGNTSASVTLTAEAPMKEVRLSLSPPGRLTGWVVDEDTGKPIANLRVSAAALRALAGVRRFGFGVGENSASTDAEGQFTVAGLTPGEYAVSIGEQTAGKDRVLTKFSEKDLKTVELDYPRTFWPGGHGPDAAIPVTLTSGSTVSVGRIAVKKVPHYRVHVRIPPSTCRAEDTMQVYESPPGGGMLTVSSETPCTQDLLITGYLPGVYRLILAVNKRSAEDREMASVPFVIADENIEITAPMERGVRVDGTFVAADDAKPPDFSKLQISLSPDGMLPFIDIVSPVQSDSKGNFHLVGIPPLSCEVSVSGAGPRNDVKEIRYNGIPIFGGVLPLDQAAMAHSLTVVIDDKPAAIAGTVMSGDKPVGKPYLILKRWPRPVGRITSFGTSYTTGDDQGRFQFAGLAPGEYRIVALRSAAEDTNRAPNTLERALDAASKIEVGPNALRNVTLEIVNLR